MSCHWVKSQITLYLYNELDDPDRVEIEQHVEGCEPCAKALEEERSLVRLLERRERTAIDANFLAACRVQLSDALEKQPRPRWHWARLAAIFGGLQLGLQPSLAAVLLIAGFVGGWVVSSYRTPTPLNGVGQRTAGGPDEFNISNISSIQAINSDPQGNLEIVFDTTRRRVLRGSASDPRVEGLLLYAANNYGNPGIRLDSIELLKARANHEDVRLSLIGALRSDLNPGVRLKALEALREFSGDPQVKEALLETLRKDDNPGVRIEAIEQLGQLRDASTVPLLQQLAARDPNNYVRLRSASALRELNVPEIY